jgi:hypothetical protein
MAKKKAEKIQHKTEAAHSGRKPTGTLKDKGWDERLRLTGDARLTEVTWSGRDHPSWPLPQK